jgi:hypothetical protein
MEHTRPEYDRDTRPLIRGGDIFHPHFPKEIREATRGVPTPQLTHGLHPRSPETYVTLPSAVKAPQPSGSNTQIGHSLGYITLTSIGDWAKCPRNNGALRQPSKRLDIWQHDLLLSLPRRPSLRAHPGRLPLLLDQLLHRHSPNPE